MYTDNKIRNVVEITNDGSHAPFSAFYVFLVPKTSASPTTTVMQGKVSLGEDNTAFPVATSYWNPIVVNKLEISIADLTNYRIFAGEE